MREKGPQRIATAAVLVIAVGLCGCLENRAIELRIDAVTPASGSTDAPVEILVTGRFPACVSVSYRDEARSRASVDYSARLSDVPLLAVSWLDNGSLAATVPSGMLPATYPLTVTDGCGRSTTAESVYTVLAPAANDGGGSGDGGSRDGGDIGPGDTGPGDADPGDALPANTFYVRRSGNDGANGQTPATAWLTLSRGVAALAPGVTVYVGAGTYTEPIVVSQAGTPGEPARLIGDRSGGMTGDAGDVVVDAAGSAHAIRVTGSDLVVAGLSVTGATASSTSAGFSMSGCSRVTLYASEAWGNSCGIDVDNASDLLIDSSSISANADEGLRFSSSTAVEVRNNLIYANPGMGLRLDNNAEVTVEANTLFQNGDVQVRSATSSDCFARYNIVVGGGDRGFAQAAGGSMTSAFNLAWNNTGGDWDGMSPSASDMSADPLFIDADGADNILGGTGRADDRFQLDVATPSPAIDAADIAASALQLHIGTMAERTTRTDGVLDGNPPDGAALNLGYHYPP